MSDPDVLVVGGGPAGLAAAVTLSHLGAAVTVVERDAGLGGVAQHADHTGYGWREFGRLMRGPRYAREWARRAEQAGVDLRTETTATGWAPDGPAADAVTLTSPRGVDTLRPQAILLATGTRERPRAARLVPGDRPLGVLTTGALQRLAMSGGRRIGERAIVVGAEHVSFSAILTLAHMGCRTVALVTPEPRHQSYGVLRLVTAGVRRVPVLTERTVARIVGRRRVEAVEVTDVHTGASRTVACDTVVFSGDWVPDHELARRGGLVMDPGTRAPRVDAGLRTSVPGVFAAGNLLHGAETAGVCVRSGAWAAASVQTWLAGDRDWPPARAVPVECDPPLRWSSPNALAPGGSAVPHGHFRLRSAEFARWPRIEVRQATRELWSGRVRRTVPTMPLLLPGTWVDQVEAGAPIRVTMTRPTREDRP